MTSASNISTSLTTIVLLTTLLCLLRPSQGLVFGGRSVSMYLEQTIVYGVQGEDKTIAIGGQILFLDHYPSGTYNGTFEIIKFIQTDKCVQVLLAVEYKDCPLLGSTVFRACRHTEMYTLSHSRMRSDVVRGTVFMIDFPIKEDSGVYYIRVKLSGQNGSDIFRVRTLINDGSLEGGKYTFDDLKHIPCIVVRSSTTPEILFKQLRGGSYGDWSSLNETIVDMPTTTPATTTTRPATAQHTTAAKATISTTTIATIKTTIIQWFDHNRGIGYLSIIAAFLVLFILVIVLTCLRVRKKHKKRDEKNKIYTGSDCDSTDNVGSGSIVKLNLPDGNAKDAPQIVINSDCLRDILAQSMAKSMDLDEEVMEKMRKKLTSLTEELTAANTKAT
ncbi:envelope glycoprotein I [Columbid alphaherpesvirus 1]|uniref:Envelope glycoprotein I n=1 Tax=Columbid alphaherpesvirus 1 TaxID=93386 RepID=A0A1V0M8P4_9ALPH|nr:envelope glycoprotein I [Columbid alphaherpesvirus 1]ARD71421.1 envelope glycoprotein I [Columbid alphaherpesvirus 1]